MRMGNGGEVDLVKGGGKDGLISVGRLGEFLDGKDGGYLVDGNGGGGVLG